MIIWSQKGSSSVTATRSPYAKTPPVLQSDTPEEKQGIDRRIKKSNVMNSIKKPYS